MLIVSKLDEINAWGWLMLHIMGYFLCLSLIGLSAAAAGAWETHPMSPRPVPTDPLSTMDPAHHIPQAPDLYVWQTKDLPGESLAGSIPVYYRNHSGYFQSVGTTTPGQTIEVEAIDNRGGILFYEIKTQMPVTLRDSKQKSKSPTSIWLSGRNLKITAAKASK